MRFRRDPAIDLMRGLAMIMVVMFHYGAYFNAPGAVQFGQMGCQIFFFASGYTSCFSLASAKRQVSFWKKRYFSLAPAFYTALIVYWGYMTLLNVIAPGQASIQTVEHIVPLICNFLLIHGFFPFCNDLYPGAWFIGTLVILYLLHPLIARIYQRAKQAHLVTVLGILCSFVLTLGFNRLLNGEWIILNNTYGYFFFVNQIGCYLLGMDLYYTRTAKRNLPVIWCLTVGSLVAAVVIFYSGFALAFSLVPILTGVFSYGFYLLLSKLLRRKKNPPARSVRNLVCQAGNYSLYIYLTHTFIVWNGVRQILKLCEKAGFTDQTALFFLLLIPCMPLVWLVAWLFRRLVEAEKKLLCRLTPDKV